MLLGYLDMGNRRSTRYQINAVLLLADPRVDDLNPGRANQNTTVSVSRVVTARASRWSTITQMNRHVCQLWLTDDTIHMSNLSLSLILTDDTIHRIQLMAILETFYFVQ